MIEIMMNLQGGAKAPLYEKIYEYIKSEITDGRIPRGERLPSTRLLAKNLAVSRSTVEMAYGEKSTRQTGFSALCTRPVSPALFP